MPTRRITLETAQALKPLDDLDLLLIEQPLYEDDIWDHRKLQQQFNTPICLDESIISAAARALRAGDGSLPDHQHQGRAGGWIEPGDCDP